MKNGDINIVFVGGLSRKFWEHPVMDKVRVSVIDKADFLIIGEKKGEFNGENYDKILAEKIFNYPELETLTDAQFAKYLENIYPEYFI